MYRNNCLGQVKQAFLAAARSALRFWRREAPPPPLVTLLAADELAVAGSGPLVRPDMAGSTGSGGAASALLALALSARVNRVFEAGDCL